MEQGVDRNTAGHGEGQDLTAALTAQHQNQNGGHGGNRQGCQHFGSGQLSAEAAEERADQRCRQGVTQDLAARLGGAEADGHQHQQVVQTQQGVQGAMDDSVLSAAMGTSGQH